MFSSKSDEWSTPQDFFDKVNKEFNFDCDVCATVENAKCSNFITAEQNGLVHPWGKVNWCNPPYSQIASWVERAFMQTLDFGFGKGKTTVMLIPARTDTKYFHKWIWDENKDDWYPHVKGRFIRGRLKFGGSKNSAPFPSMLVVFNP